MVERILGVLSRPTKHFAFQQPVMLFTSCQPDDTASTWHFLCQYSLTMLDLSTASSRCKFQVHAMKTLQHQDGRKSAFNIQVYAKEQRQASPPLTHLRKPATPPTTLAGNLHAILRALPSATSPNLEFCSVPKPRVPIMDSSPLAVFAKPAPKTPGLQAIALQDLGEAGMYFGSRARQKQSGTLHVRCLCQDGAPPPPWALAKFSATTEDLEHVSLDVRRDGW